MERGTRLDERTRWDAYQHKMLHSRANTKREVVACLLKLLSQDVIDGFGGKLRNEVQDDMRDE